MLLTTNIKKHKITYVSSNVHSNYVGFQENHSKTRTVSFCNTKRENENFRTSLKTLLPFWIQNFIIIKDETIIYTSSKDLLKLVNFLRYHTNTRFLTVSELTGIDYPENKKRFEVVYFFLSPFYHTRLRIKTLIDEVTPLPSLTGLFPGVGWMEREAWDMFGIYFYNHPDLRRILTDYGFDGFPLTKNYPLSGYTEVRYDDEQKRVVNESIEITQEYRNFDMVSPWVETIGLGEPLEN